jgi:hypothetical protein
LDPDPDDRVIITGVEQTRATKILRALLLLTNLETSR